MHEIEKLAKNDSFVTVILGYEEDTSAALPGICNNDDMCDVLLCKVSEECASRAKTTRILDTFLDGANTALL